jgi:acetyltransferase-like isoleucine patch superfamily enzyme
MDIKAFKEGIKEDPLLMKIISMFYNYIFGRNSIRVKGKQSRLDIKPNVLLCNNKIVIEGDNNVIEIDNGSRLSNTYIYIWGSGHHLKIANDVIYRKGTMLLKDKDCVISFGDGTTVEDAYIVASEGGRILIGRDCLIGHGVDIRNGDSHSIIDVETKKRLNPSKDIVIGDHVWLGAYSQILKGANIGENSVVGLRSVVTTEIPGNSVCVGVPAKVVKENITWSRERI